MSKILDLESAILTMRAGGVVVYPTETYLALGCVVNNINALEKIFTFKRRSQDVALPLIIANTSQLEQVVDKLTPALERLLMKLELFFWPGPLTVLFPSSSKLSHLITGNSGEVAVRISSHPQAKELASRLGPLVSSSANFSGEKPVVLPDDLPVELLNLCDGYVIAKPKPAGLAPSTVVRPNPEGTGFSVLREGVITANRLRAAGFIIEDN